MRRSKGANLTTLFLLTGLIWFAPGCSTIHFVQYEQAGEQTPDSYWHHTLLNGMIEISKPLNLQQVCGDTVWTKLTVERSFWNILIGLPIPSTDFVVPYVAWTNRVYCFQAASDNPTRNTEINLGSNR